MNETAPMEVTIELTRMPPTKVAYRFVSVYRIGGFIRLPTASECAGADCPIVTGMTDTTAYLTENIGDALLDVDRGAAMGLFMLAVDGPRDSARVLNHVESQAREFAQERMKKLPTSSVFLVVEANGFVETKELHPVRDLGPAVVAFDAVDKRALRASHQRSVEAVVASVVVTIGKHFRLNPIRDGISLTLPDGRSLYSLSIEVRAEVTTSRAATVEDVANIQRVLACTLHEPQLATPLRLAVLALGAGDDRLEAFLLAWAALESLVGKYTGNCESGNWVALVADTALKRAQALHADFVQSGHKSYSLVQRTRSFCLLYGIEDDDLIRDVKTVKTEHREPLYHRGDVSTQLPVERVISIVLRLTGAVVDRSNAGHEKLHP